MIIDSWLDVKAYDNVEQAFVESTLGKAEAENEMNYLIAQASFDAGFEAGVLASEAGVGRADN